MLNTTFISNFLSFQLLNSGNFNNKRDACTETDLALGTKEASSSNCICNANVSIKKGFFCKIGNFFLQI